MLMKNFDTDLDRQGVTRLVTSETVVVTEEVKVTRPDPEGTHREHLTKLDGDWDWRALRDYVITEIESRFGVIPHDALKEKGIFDSFCRRWGPQAADIARYAFEIADGRWRGAPISITRFCVRSDPYFADVIAERLGAAST